MEKLGGLDVIIANAGWTRFSAFGDLNALPIEDWNKVPGFENKILLCLH
jgi:hypothetical protein